MIILAITAAVLWGSGNFSMSTAVRRSSPRATVIVGFSAGLLTACTYFLFQGPQISPGSFLWGGVAGVAQGAGWICFARSISKTSLAISAPVAASTTTLSLLAYSVANGYEFPPLSLIGLFTSLIALVIFSLEVKSGARAKGRSDVQGLMYAIIAGAFFALQALALVNAGTESSALVLVGAGSGVVLLLLMTTAFKPVSRTLLVQAAPHACVGGFMLFLGDLCYLFALHRGAPAGATVVAQLHPLLTAVLALVVLRERLERSQLAGVLLALCGIIIISASQA